jgi:hypothetical protein
MDGERQRRRAPLALDVKVILIPPWIHCNYFISDSALYRTYTGLHQNDFNAYA